MPIQPFVFYRDDMPGALTTVFTYMAVRGVDVVGFVQITNGSDVEATAYVHVVPFGQVADDGNAKVNGMKVPPKGTKIVAGWWPMQADGDMIQCRSVGTRLALDVTGIRRT